MAPPTNIKDIQKLNGIVVALNKFVSRLADKCLPFFKALRGPFQRTKDCQEAFDHLKKYLASPPTLAAPKEGEILLMYLAVTNETIAAILVRQEVSNQRPEYHLCRVLQPVEMRYVRV
ncbi:hypothetical protein HRI_003231700 [Hibiscus trionum]|uniref:Reverse transcriptase/retrotransposon-derived protein RNase H-like domain-containing protein n=1 Tax=Hibiscus trionum TaxID=183268 RepID=A0A9W7IF15_HIBTR|nr:hypothetical protein HRI_003231700 [Hibiscus trionum]